MSIVRTIAKNPDIYDALVDNHDIELVGIETVDQLIVEIDNKINDHNVTIMEYNGCDTSEWMLFTAMHADLCMIKGFIALLVYSEQRAND